MLFRNIPPLVIALSLLVLCSQASAKERDREHGYPFVAQGAGNSFGHYICAGLASGIECLEQGTQIEGIEPSEALTRRVWDKLIFSNSEPFEYYGGLRLRDGTTVPICSKVAIEEIGFLVQEKYSDMVSTELWQEHVERPDPNSREGRALLEARQKYTNLTERKNENSITEKSQLKDFIDQDEDGLVAFSGRGQRIFENGPPRQLIDKHGLIVDPETGKRSNAVPSNHAFLLTHDADTDQFYVYDSDDPDGKWPVTVEGSGNQFRIGWRIDDHMGNGPSLQVYYDVRPQNQQLRGIRDIIDGND